MERHGQRQRQRHQNWQRPMVAEFCPWSSMAMASGIGNGNGPWSLNFVHGFRFSK
jgi:hypothetical protein